MTHALFLVAALAGSPQAENPLKPHHYSAGVAFCSIIDKQINESSGIAASNAFPGTYYTHNDSGDTARFFRFDKSGAILSVQSLKGVKATDWEGMATARLGGKSYVYLGDIGDNNAVRNSIQVYRCQESTLGSISNFDSYTISYPDGARDAETLMVHPKSGDIWIVSKVASGKSRVYFLPRPRKSGSFTLKFVGEVRVGDPVPFGERVTDGAISHDGRFVALRTYTAIVEFAVGSDFSKWYLGSSARVSPPFMTQAEAITYSKDDEALLVTSEGNPCPVSILHVSSETSQRGDKQL